VGRLQRARHAAQAEVESYFISNSYVMPTFHKMYWMGGVSSVAKYPNFSWIDGSAGIYPSTYQNWGKMGSLLEPNNAIAPPEFCMVANFSQAYGSPRRWGWSDVNCNLVQATFLCRVMPPVVKYCKAEGTGSDYILNTNKMSFDDAMGFCNNCGGLLVSYDNMTEQRDVERCFIVSGSMVPRGSACGPAGMVHALPRCARRHLCAPLSGAPACRTTAGCCRASTRSTGWAWPAA
jgi:hypothetical protein